MKKSSPYPRLLIAAPHSGAGKTTTTLALMAALKNRGLVVQGFKCGPDYIDPGYHRAITGRTSHNLDSWFVKPSLVKKIFSDHASDADISIIEGVMGLFDGKNPANDEGSSAHIAGIIHAPVILILDARSMARSAAALVRGFQVFSRKTNIAAVILNKCGSLNHLGILREAIEKECRIPVLGGFLKDDKIQIPERQLGLLPALERGELNALFQNLSDLAEKSIDIDKLLKISNWKKIHNPDQFVSPPPKKLTVEKNAGSPAKKVSVAIARDDAFNFYYPENLEVMEKAGMGLLYFSPLKNEPLPADAAGLYLGGGFPEEFARVLAKNMHSMNSIQKAINSGLPTIAECGGFMYLTQAITDLRKKKYKMSGVLPGEVIMHDRLAALGYREITGLDPNDFLRPGEVIRGHEFHYSTYEPQKTENDRNVMPAYRIKGRNVDQPSGMIYKNLVAGYAHFYFLSNPSLVKRWAAKCLEYSYSGALRQGKT